MLYHTNGTIYDQEIVDLWSKFKSVKVMLSIDGYGIVNDIIRRPSTWKNIENNLKLYDETADNIVVSINTTVQLLNVDSLVDFASWLLDQKFKKIGHKTDNGIYFASLLHYPDYLSVQVIPKSIKERISNDVKQFVKLHPDNKGIARLLDIIEFMNASNKENLLSYTLDFIEKADIDKTLPIIFQMMDNFQTCLGIKS
jgi:hypothetical protein